MALAASAQSCQWLDIDVPLGHHYVVLQQELLLWVHVHRKRRRRLAGGKQPCTEGLGRKEGVKGKLLEKGGKSGEWNSQVAREAGEPFQNKGMGKEDEDREAALRFSQNEVVDDLGKSSVVGVLGDGNQRSGY